MATIDKQQLTSMNITEEQVLNLKQLFPEVFTEGLKIDWDKLRLTLGETVDVGKERYGMNWPGKAECFKTIQQPSIATLVPAREESIDFDTSENLFIEGDNLEVLKLLQKSCLGKIKMMYFDPPYNTGGDFIYPDNFSESLETYLKYTSQIDDEGRKYQTNAETDGRFHSKWMNMMYPRLFLSKNLLREDGLIFISIDDNEVSNLRLICNEIFGEENFVDSICWKKKYGGGAKEKYLVSVHEYILVYAKNIYELPEILVEFDYDKARKFYKYKDDKFEKLGYYRTHPLEAVKSFDIRENLRFPVTAPDGTLAYPKRQWRWGPAKFQEAIARDEVIFSKNKEGEWVLSSKQYLNDETGIQRKTKAQSVFDDIYTQEGTKEIFDLFGDAKIFSFPKPVRLLKKVIEIGGLNDNDIILDIFSGSASTAQAIFELNENDNGKRKFILVQLPESCSTDSEAYKAGFKTIAEVSKERIRRSSSKIKSKIEQEKIEQSSTLFNDIDDNIKLDLGFKVFKLNNSNFKIWDTTLEKEPEAIQQRLFEHVEHISPEAAQESILFELLLKSGFELTTPIEKLTLADKTVYSIAGGQLLICLEKELTNEVIKAMAELQPTRVICLDEAFTGANADALKTNAVQIMKSKGVVNFRTV